MKRIALTDRSGQWFNEETAEIYKEKQDFNGSNHISRATGSQFNHEAIYITKGGKFVLNCWSNWQGSTETYELVSNEFVAKWFAKQGFGDDEIPCLFKEGVMKLEIL